MHRSCIMICAFFKKNKITFWPKNFTFCWDKLTTRGPLYTCLVLLTNHSFPFRLWEKFGQYQFSRQLIFIFSLPRMSYNDFMSNFTRVEICMLSPDSAGDSDKKRWEMEINQGTWQKHVSAGGCRNFPDTFYSNPQYR